MWIFWALLSAVLVANRRPLEKKIINKVHHFTYGFLVQCVSLPIVTAMVVLSGKMLNPLELGYNFWLPLVLASVCYHPLNAFLYKHAIKDGELSKVLPIQSLWPVFALLLAWVTIGEAPGAIAALGVIATVLGVYALGLKGKKLHHPLQPFKEDSSSRAMLAGVVLVTFVSILEKVAINGSNPLFYSFASTVCAMLTLLLSMAISKQRITPQIKPLLKQFGAIGTLQSTSYATYILAISAGPVAYVSALRSTNILMGSLLGVLLLNEKLTTPKIISFVLIVIGSLLLTLG